MYNVQSNNGTGGGTSTCQTLCERTVRSHFTLPFLSRSTNKSFGEREREWQSRMECSCLIWLCCAAYIFSIPHNKYSNDGQKKVLLADESIRYQCTHIVERKNRLCTLASVPSSLSDLPLKLLKGLTDKLFPTRLPSANNIC
jgi:hypothetical protein